MRQKTALEQVRNAAEETKGGTGAGENCSGGDKKAGMKQVRIAAEETKDGTGASENCRGGEKRRHWNR